jgi:ketosteroid isomerase-like protein
VVETLRVSREDENLATARRFLAAIEARDPTLSEFFTPDVLQWELPNRVTPNGARRGLQEMAEAGERGRKVLTAERYEVLEAVAQGNLVALEVRWTGTLAVAYGSIPVGGQITAHLAMFMEFRDGKICAQRNYDCFDPF